MATGAAAHYSAVCGDGPPAYNFLIAIRRPLGDLVSHLRAFGGIIRRSQTGTKISEHFAQGKLCPLTAFAVFKHSQSGRVAVMANKVMKKAIKKKQPARRRVGKGATRALGERVLAQGTGRVADRAFGCKMSVPRGPGLHPKSWDAFATAHAPLPRSVGPYTVVRTSFLTQTTAKCGFICTFKKRPFDLPGAGAIINGGWSNCVMATQQGPNQILSSTSTGFHYAPFPGGTSVGAPNQTTFTCCPAAISVQIMGPEALLEAGGQMAAAVVPARLDLTGDTRTWDEVQTLITSYFRPRLLSAGKITLRGVQMDSHPLSMSDVSSFEPLLHSPPNPNMVDAAVWDENQPYPCGWAPLAFVNPTGAPLQLLIAVEWRVRFDVGNPAVSSHQHHGVSTDLGWDQQIRRASDALPGVVDIVERVANTGMGLYARASAAGII